MEKQIRFQVAPESRDILACEGMIFQLRIELLIDH